MSVLAACGGQPSYPCLARGQTSVVRSLLANQLQDLAPSPSGLIVHKLPAGEQPASVLSLAQQDAQPGQVLPVGLFEGTDWALLRAAQLDQKAKLLEKSQPVVPLQCLLPLLLRPRRGFRP